MDIQRITIIFIGLFLSFNSYVFSQDSILKLNGEIIKSQIITIDINTIIYKKYDNLNGPTYVIEKKDVAEIIFSNGITETIIVENTETSSEQNPKIELSLNETKDLIVKGINEHGFEEDSFKSRYKASFENNYLRLSELRKNSSKEKNDGILFDFSNVYKFQRISKRSEKLAFLNIWISIVKNEKKNKFDKHKLIIRIDDANNAEAILSHLKHLNKLLLEKQRE